MFKIKSHYFTSIGAGTYSLFICLQNIVCKNTRVVDILTESQYWRNTFCRTKIFILFWEKPNCDYLCWQILSWLSWISPKTLLKSSHPKKYLPNFSTPKISESNISNLKNSFNHPCHLKSGVTHLGLSSIKPPTYIQSVTQISFYGTAYFSSWDPSHQRVLTILLLI